MHSTKCNLYSLLTVLKLLIEFYFLVLFWEMSGTPIKIIKAKNIHFFVLVKYLTTLIVVYFC